jgi:hypothetical protein
MAVQYSYGIKYRTELIDKLQISKSTGFTMQDIPGYQFGEKAVDQFQDIVQRPLFFKERKPVIPPEGNEAETVVATEKVDFVLTGVIDSPKGIYCLLQNPRKKEKNERFRRLWQGDEIDGWTVDEIHLNRIVIVAAGKSKVLELSKPRPNAMKNRAKKNRRKPKVKRNPFKQRLSSQKPK